MNDFAVDVAGLAGFKLDLQDLGTNFTTNTSRLLPGVVLPTGSAGLIATLAPAFERFQSTVSSTHQTDLAAIEALAVNLSTAGNRFRATDENSANAISAIAPSDTAASNRASEFRDAKRFSGLQLPSLSDVQENQYTVRQVVTSAIDKISAYDERLSATVGFKPTADYLTPLVADWEALQAVGKRIGLLGINDYVTSENLVGGTRWLQGTWSGDASQSFSASADSLGRSVFGRSADLDTVAKIVENSAACLERLVYNQAMGLSGGILQPKSYLGATFPLGVWAQLVNSPADESIRAEITAAFDALKQSAQTRRDTIATMIDKISTALDYLPGRTAPSFNPSEFELPDRVSVDLGAIKYGFGDNVWWEDSIATS